MLSVDHFYAVLGCFGMSFEMHWICLDPLVSIDTVRSIWAKIGNLLTESYSLMGVIIVLGRIRVECGSVCVD